MCSTHHCLPCCCLPQPAPLLYALGINLMSSCPTGWCGSAILTLPPPTYMWKLTLAKPRSLKKRMGQKQALVLGHLFMCYLGMRISHDMNNLGVLIIFSSSLLLSCCQGHEDKNILVWMNNPAFQGFSTGWLEDHFQRKLSSMAFLCGSH